MGYYYYLVSLQPILLLLLFFYFYTKRKFTYWSSRGIGGPTPSIFKLGTILDRIRFSPSEYEIIYQQRYGKIYGLYRLFHPTLTIIDADLLKQILIKDFHLFINRAKLNTYDQLWNENVFHTQAANWKRIRTITSPTFTSGKLKGMHRLMTQCVDKLIAYFEKITAADGVFSAKEVLAGFTIDVIASTSFATETNANDDRSRQNAVVTNGINLFHFNPLKILSFLLMPRAVNDLLGIKTQFPEKPFRFFENLTREIVKQRKEGAVKRNDFVQLLMDAFVFESDLKDGDNYEKLTADMERDETKPNPEKPNLSKKNTLTDTEVIAQSVFFFIAGFETTASTLTHLIYELVKNEDIQERLHEELKKFLAGLDVESDVYLETVMTRIPYLDAVVKETLRKYPPLTRVERRCSVDGYKLGTLTLEKDQHIEIPLYAVHHSPEYYPNPELYDPERFMPENKHLLVPYTYMPFGAGPRNCLGLRFAYQEIKMVIAQIVLRFRFSSTFDTPTELKYKKSTLLLNTLPFKIRVSKRF